jgi:hypothetical protein
MALDLCSLQKVTQAVFYAERNRLQKAISDEALLRMEIDNYRNLQEMRVDNTDLGPLYTIGADLAWQDWLDLKLSILYQELAMVMARKAQLLQTVNSSFGRDLAASELLKIHRQQHRKIVTEKIDVRLFEMLASLRLKR